VEGAPHRAASHLLAFEVALRRGKLLAALRAVRAALVLEGPASPEVHRATVRLAQAAVAQAASSGGGGGGGEDGAAEAAAAAAREVLGAQVAALLGGAEPAAFHAAWAREHGGASLPHRAAAAEMEAALRPEARAQAARGLAEAGPPGGATHAQCVAVEELLGGALGDAAAAAEWRRRCAEVFRWSRHFGGPECVPLEGPEGGAADVDGAAEGVAQLAV
jgi:peptide alpha-N-acetyltransferase